MQNAKLICRGRRPEEKAKCKIDTAELKSLCRGRRPRRPAKNVKCNFNTKTDKILRGVSVFLFCGVFSSKAYTVNNVFKRRAVYDT